MDKFSQVMDEQGKLRIVGRYHILIYETHLSKSELYEFLYKTVFENKNDVIAYIAHLPANIKHNFLHTRILIDTIKAIDWKSKKRFLYGSLEPYDFDKYKKTEWEKEKNIIKEDINYFPKQNSDEEISIGDYRIKNNSGKCKNYEYCKNNTINNSIICNNCSRLMKPDKFEVLEKQVYEEKNKIKEQIKLRNKMESLDPDFKFRESFTTFITQYRPGISNGKNIIEILQSLENKLETLEQENRVLKFQNYELSKTILKPITTKVEDNTVSGVFFIRLGDAHLLTDETSSDNWAYIMTNRNDIDLNKSGVYIHYRTTNYINTIKIIKRKTCTFNNIKLKGYFYKVDSGDLDRAMIEVNALIYKNDEYINKCNQDINLDKYNNVFVMEDEKFRDEFQKLNVSSLPCSEMDIV